MIVFWEDALLIKSGWVTGFHVQNWNEKLQQTSGIRFLPPTISEMLRLAALPPHHKDPFDLLLIAQALTHQMILITKD